jgi:hypothetical protein
VSIGIVAGIVAGGGVAPIELSLFVFVEPIELLSLM